MTLTDRIVDHILALEASSWQENWQWESNRSLQESNQFRAGNQLSDSPTYIEENV
jgi:hypothetical protein